MFVYVADYTSFSRPFRSQEERKEIFSAATTEIGKILVVRKKVYALHWTHVVILHSRQLQDHSTGQTLLPSSCPTNGAAPVSTHSLSLMAAGQSLQQVPRVGPVQGGR